MNFASICILSYERPAMLRRCIESIERTADYPYELLVHDDGSADKEVRRYLDSLLDEHRVSTVITNPPLWNQGQGIALNRLFHMAKGDPIVKMDQDMTFEQGWLRRSVEILEASKVTGDRVGALGLFNYYHAPVHAAEMFLEARDRGGVTWEEHRDFVGSAMVIPRKAWVDLGPFEERSSAFAEDAVFKQKVTDTPGWCCALPPEDLATNHGFGIGPSTVVVAENEVRSIKTQPKVLIP